MRASTALMATSSLMIASPVAASAPLAPVRSHAQELQLQRCIQRSAQGRAWLGKTLWGLRDQEGGWVGAAVRNSDGTDDLGPLQVNSWWAGRIAALLGRPPVEVRRWLQYDACFNIDAARWIFLSALGLTRDYWKAVGVYHSPVASRQRRYAQSVAQHLSCRFGPSIFRPARASVLPPRVLIRPITERLRISSLGLALLESHGSP